MATLGNIVLEPCSVTWNGTDLGYTDGDIEVTTDEQAVDIVAHQEGTNVLDAIRTGNSVEIALALKETSLAQLQTLIGTGGGNDSGVAQVTDITCVADSSGSLNNTIMFITGKNPTTKVVTNYVVWFNVNSAGTDPSIPGYTSVEVAVATSAADTAVASALTSALDALADFGASAASEVVTVTNAEAGAVTAPDAGNTGFTVAIDTTGVSQLYGWGKSQNFTGMLADSAKLVLHPVKNISSDLADDLAFWKAYPVLNSIVKSGENPQMVNVTFRIFPDLSKPDATRLFVLGDHT